MNAIYNYIGEFDCRIDQNIWKLWFW